MTSVQPELRLLQNMTSSEGSYVYIFGGIKVKNETDILFERLKYNISVANSSSFEYMSDMWRFDIKSNQWENLEVFGIVSIKRMISLWNGTNIFIEVPP
jgi:N-acetylneuraminic acid mutarotase